MATIINLHALQSVPASLLNRDDNNSAKGLTVGSVRRDRISSQSWKRAVRTDMRNTTIDGGVWSNRTNRLPRQVIALLTNEFNHDPDQADVAVGALFKAMGLKRKDNGDTSVGIFAATTAPEALANLVHTHFDTLSTGEKPDKELTQAAIATLDVNGAIDLALFGRMLAEIPTGRIDGAAGYSHPFGITPTTVEPDFFTAVDDCADDGEPVSGNLGMVDLTAPVLYRYAYLDVNQLAHNLAGSDNLVNPAIAAFIRHTALAVPAAKGRAAAAQTRPDILVATIGHHALSAANAYTQPVEGENVITDGVNRLIEQLDYATKLEDHTTIILPLSQAAASAVADSDATIVDTLDEFITAITAAGEADD